MSRSPRPNDVGSVLYTVGEFGLMVAAFVPPMAVVAHRHRNDPTRRVPGRWLRRFGRATVDLSPLWNFSIDGQPPADIDRRAHIVVANHESMADPFLLSFLPWDMRWVAKDELFRAPVVGMLMRLGGDIPLRRGDRASVGQMFDECRRTIQHGMNVMIFPEGTRTRGEDLGPFKTGAFDLAVALGAPVLPIALAGTRRCVSKAPPYIARATAIARVLPVIESVGRTSAEVSDTAREAIRVAVADLRSTLATRPSASPNR